MIRKIVLISVLLLSTSGCSYYAKGYYYASKDISKGWSAEKVEARVISSKAAPLEEKTLYTYRDKNCSIKVSSSYQLTTKLGVFGVPLIPIGFIDEITRKISLNVAIEEFGVAESCSKYVNDLSVYINRKKVGVQIANKNKVGNVYYFNMWLSEVVSEATSLKLVFSSELGVPPLKLKRVKGKSILQFVTV